ncbi:MAG: hypothetical protein MUF36_00065 [Bacteroidales bacterium]|jgi:hypothetical protein|nr:hypothetical protein [Bacteroidales bacterium]
MRSSKLDLTKYNTDKIESGYLTQYDEEFASLVQEDIRLLELGIRDGGSLLLWKDYFPESKIAGIDIKLPEQFQSVQDIFLYEGSQADPVFLSNVASEVAPDGFDIIIDDASHIGELTSKAFWHLFDNHLKKGGVYVIEDWGTGYWSDWPDGKSFRPHRSFLRDFRLSLMSKFNSLRHIPFKMPVSSHNYGMVGFIKSLVDEQGASDLSRMKMREKSTRSSKFAKMIIYPHIVFIHKSKQ